MCFKILIRTEQNLGQIGSKMQELNLFVMPLCHHIGLFGTCLGERLCRFSYSDRVSSIHLGAVDEF